MCKIVPSATFDKIWTLAGSESNQPFLKVQMSWIIPEETSKFIASILSGVGRGVRESGAQREGVHSAADGAPPLGGQGPLPQLPR